MKRWLTILFLCAPCLLLCRPCSAQDWVNILQPTYGGSPCTLLPTGTYAGCGVDWTQVGVPGGVPTGTQSGSTIAAPACGNGSSDCTSTINTALSSCGGSSGSEKYVMLGAGTFLYDGVIAIPSYCYLIGQGANNTILKQGSSSSRIVFVAAGGDISASGAVNITAGGTAGSTSETLSSTSGVSAGMFMVVSELNNPTYVDVNGSEGLGSGFYCIYNWGDGAGLARARCEIVAITNVAGSVVTTNPPLLTTYGGTAPSWSATTYYGEYAYITNGTNLYEQTANISGSPYHCLSGSSTPSFPGSGSVSDGTCTWTFYSSGTTLQAQAIPYSAVATYAGLENVQIYDNGLTGFADIGLYQCAYCWAIGNEVNYTSDDWVRDYEGFRNEIRNNYFSNSFSHGPGGADVSVDLYHGTSGTLVQNNICERGHVGCAMLEEGAAGNVIAYNYSTGQFPGGVLYWNVEGLDYHGAHPQFNLAEGNVWNTYYADSVWGSSSHGVLFRNWEQGTVLNCNPITASVSTRQSVVCSLLGYPSEGGSYNSWYEYQQADGVALTYAANFFNVIGDVIGSSQAQSLVNSSNSALTQNASITWYSGVNLTYGAGWYGLLLGFSETADTGSFALDSARPSTTLLQHGTYNNVSASITWTGSITHTLPCSFFLASCSTPSWWPSNVPFPAVGPDVTGGSGPGGHVYSTSAANAAQNCYLNVMGGVDGGAGSPLTFNANTCYAGTANPIPPAPALGMFAWDWNWQDFVTQQ